jgi:hypothetical protein
MNSNVTDFKIVFNEELFNEYNLSKEDFWFDIKFLVNNVFSFDITNLTTEEIYNFIIKLEDILEDKDTKIYLDEYNEIYLESTKEYIKFYSEFEKSNGIIKISSSFENNQIVRNEFSKFSAKIKDIVSSWHSEDINDFQIIADEMSENLKCLFHHDNIKDELDNIKSFANKYPEIKKNPENLAENIVEEFKLLVQTYNQKLMTMPEFISTIRKIDSIEDKENKKKILEIVMKNIKNSIVL